MNTTDFKLRERVKELNCLYELSRAGWEVENDIDALAKRTLKILPAAMQYPALAEVNIQIGTRNYTTTTFKKTSRRIQCDLIFDKKKYGQISVVYRKALVGRNRKVSFLPEEKHLLRTVARELSLLIKKASVEEEKDKLQAQLRHVERLALVGELSAGIAHELNEPLGRILGFAQLIKRTGGLSVQQADDIERIVKASLYTREIIKKLMIFSRQMPQQLTKVNLNEVIENILYFIDVRFQSRGIMLKTRLDESLPKIHADEVQMSQVLVNLITNAVHAMPNGGAITVSTRKKRNHISLMVKDTGSGMSPEVKERIFEPFFTTKPVGQGTGLGLSVVQGIIESHKGKIVVSSAPGKGAKFEISLPLQLKK